MDNTGLLDLEDLEKVGAGKTTEYLKEQIENIRNKQNSGIPLTQDEEAILKEELYILGNEQAKEIGKGMHQ